jgi:hypothetical protein
MSNLKSAVLGAALFFFAACAPDIACSRRTGPTRIVLNTATSHTTIDVVDVAAPQLDALRGTSTRQAWAEVFRVAVATDQPPMLGDYQIDGSRIRFTPLFPFDPGRQYHVTFAPAGAAPITCNPHHAHHRSRAGVPERRRRARESVASLRALLSADGHEGRA